MTGSKQYPEPAHAVSGGLGLTNLELLNFAPMACARTGFNYYDALIVKTIGPFVVLALLWIWPLICAILGNNSYTTAARTAARLSVLWVELIYVSVSTTVMECFKCDAIGDKYWLRAQLTLPCDENDQRRQIFKLMAAIMIMVYPIGAPRHQLSPVQTRNKHSPHTPRTLTGVPLLLFGILYPKRAEIQKLMQAAQMQDEANSESHQSLENLNKKTRRTSISDIILKIGWLSSTFEAFEPTKWWMRIFMLVTRLCQTRRVDCAPLALTTTHSGHGCGCAV